MKRPYMKADLVRDGLGKIDRQFGPQVADQARRAGKHVAQLAEEWHGPIVTAGQAQRRAAYLAECGNYPTGMSVCEVAGMNGDSPDVCLFADTEHCTCD